MVSISCWRRRFPVCLLTCRKEMRSFLATAGYKAIGQETRESFKKPFQCARGTKAITLTELNQDTLQMDISACFLSPPLPPLTLFSRERNAVVPEALFGTNQQLGSCHDDN